MKSRTQRYLSLASGSLFILLFSMPASTAQDTAKVPTRFAGAVTVTNKGISTVPNLTLGKPAAIFDFTVAKQKLSFEPQLRFALEGKPWSFLFWWRYKLLKTEKFQLNLGAHPALSFKRKMIPLGSIEKEEMVVRRYLAGELAPSYLISKNATFGLYWLYSRGIENDLTQNTNLISVRGSLSNLKISDRYYLRINPQLYYLIMDGVDGVYFNSSVTLANRNFPVAVSALVNQPVKTNIVIGNEFLWNISLVYSFGRDYIEN